MIKKLLGSPAQEQPVRTIEEAAKEGADAMFAIIAERDALRDQAQSYWNSLQVAEAMIADLRTQLASIQAERDAYLIESCNTQADMNALINAIGPLVTRAHQRKAREMEIAKQRAAEAAMEARLAGQEQPDQSIEITDLVDARPIPEGEREQIEKIAAQLAPRKNGNGHHAQA